MGKKSRLKIIKRQERAGQVGKKGKTKLKRALIAILILAITGAGGYYGYTWMSKRKTTPTPETTAPQIEVNGGNAEGLTVTPVNPNTGEALPPIEVQAQ